jgi:hypothetical protein
MRQNLLPTAMTDPSGSRGSPAACPRSSGQLVGQSGRPTGGAIRLVAMTGGALLEPEATPLVHDALRLCPPVGHATGTLPANERPFSAVHNSAVADDRRPAGAVLAGYRLQLTVARC